MNPWENRAALGTLPALWETIKNSMANPVELFAATPREGGLQAPLAYGTILLALGFAGACLWQVIGNMLGMGMTPFLPQDEQGAQLVGGVVGLGIAALMIVLSPLFGLIGLMVNAGITHLGLILVGGNRHGFEATVRGIAYAQGPQVLGLIPCVGYLAGVWVLVLEVIGLSRLHEIPWWQALLGKFVFACLCGLLCGLFAIVVIAVFVALGPQLKTMFANAVPV